jgi:hypothetical protein
VYEDAIRTAYGIMRDPEAPHRVRASTALRLIERHEKQQARDGESDGAMARAIVGELRALRQLAQQRGGVPLVALQVNGGQVTVAPGGPPGPALEPTSESARPEPRAESPAPDTI